MKVLSWHSWATVGYNDFLYQRTAKRHFVYDSAKIADFRALFTKQTIAVGSNSETIHWDDVQHFQRANTETTQNHFKAKNIQTK